MGRSLSSVVHCISVRPYLPSKFPYFIRHSHLVLGLPNRGLTPAVPIDRRPIFITSFRLSVQTRFRPSRIFFSAPTPPYYIYFVCSGSILARSHSPIVFTPHKHRPAVDPKIFGENYFFFFFVLVLRTVFRPTVQYPQRSCYPFRNTVARRCI